MGHREFWQKLPVAHLIFTTPITGIVVTRCHYVFVVLVLVSLCRLNGEDDSLINKSMKGRRNKQY